MKEVYKNFLKTKGIYVGNSNADPTEAAFLCAALVAKFGIKIVSGAQFVTRELFNEFYKEYTIQPVEPFYRGFPESVKKLDSNQLLMDQVINYFLSYTLGNFDHNTHSVFEESVDRVALKGHVVIRKFKVIDEEEAMNYIVDVFNNICAGSRPLNRLDYEVLKELVMDGNKFNIKCKDDICKLIIDTKDITPASNLKTADVIRLVEWMMFFKYYNKRSINKLNLCNQERKLVTDVLNYTFESENFAIRIFDCIEKRKQWKGLLTHIHYNPKTDFGKAFKQIIFNDDIKSEMSTFESWMRNRDPVEAMNCLVRSKGTSMGIRNIDYILSRCKTQEEVNRVLDLVFNEDVKNIILVQQILRYATYNVGQRDFVFSKFNLMKKHHETNEEYARRKSAIDVLKASSVINSVKTKLSDNLHKANVGRVYVDPSMKNIAIPLNNSTGNSGRNSLPTGSRIKLPEGDIVRLFTYWEKVNDIDLSAVIINADGTHDEFSWRTYRKKDYYKGLTHSGDCVSGYNGGSEYIDININEYLETNPKARYIICANTVYSRQTFDTCDCIAGFMIRDGESGEIFEPKTVKTSYSITGATTRTDLFAIDLFAKEVVWLNVNMDSTINVAGSDLGYLSRYFNTARVLNLYDVFSNLGVSQVNDINDILNNATENDILALPEYPEFETKAEVITPLDTDKIIKYLFNN